MIRISGIALTEKRCLGVVVHCQREMHFVSHTPESISRELEVYRQAVARFQMDLSSQMQWLDDLAKSILATHSAIANDCLINDFVEQKINDGNSAAAAIVLAKDYVRECFAKGESLYIRERLTDVEDVLISLRSYLSQPMTDIVSNHGPFVAIQDYFLPSEVIRLAKNHAVGLLATTGANHSHSAILAQSYNLAYIVVDEAFCQEIRPNDLVLLDGKHGHVYLNPDSGMVEKIMRDDPVTENDNMRTDLPNHPDLPAIYATLNVIDELDVVAKSDVKGIGLVRTEYLFGDAASAPDEAKQYQVYLSIAQAMSPRQVTFRTFDFGDDKGMVWFALSATSANESNKRGIGLLLTRIPLLKVQLRALIRAASIGNCRILLPYVQTESDILLVKRVIGEVMVELKNEGILIKENVPLGAMIETRAGLKNADAIARQVDFFSIGTNDLVRSELLNGNRQEERDFLFKVIDPLFAIAASHQLTTDICGFMAEDVDAIGRFIDLGVTSLVVSMDQINTLLNAAPQKKDGS